MISSICISINKASPYSVLVTILKASTFNAHNNSIETNLSFCFFFNRGRNQGTEKWNKLPDDIQLSEHGKLRVTTGKPLYYTVLCVCGGVLQVFWCIVKGAYRNTRENIYQTVDHSYSWDKGRIKKREGQRKILIFFLNQLLYCLEIFTIKML